LGSVERRNPRNSFRREELALWNVLVRPLRIIKHASFDYVGSSKGLTSAKNRCTAVRAEMRRDILARIGNFRDRLQVSRFQRKVLVSNDDVVTISRTANLTAVIAVT